MNSAQAVLEIDLSKIRDNYRTLSALCRQSEIAAVVKADAYGLGAVPISQALLSESVKKFFVASVAEGVALREKLPGSEIQIFVLYGVFRNDVKPMLEYNLTPVLNHYHQIQIWEKVSISRQKKCPCLININTGINRLGMQQEDLDFIVDNPEVMKSLDVKYVMSHLAASEHRDNEYNKMQLEKFKSHLKIFNQGIFSETKYSFANSGGIFLGKEYHFDMVRPGAALYGINPTTEKINPMKNPLRLTAPIIQLQDLAKGESIGYNMTFTTSRRSKIATIPLGYADGYFRMFGNKGDVYIDGQRAPVVGVISMDLVNIDVTDLPPEKTFLGAEVEVIGDNCTPDRLANVTYTIGYEIITSLGKRYKRVYKSL